MDDLTATLIAEQVQESDEETYREAWQHLLNTDLCWCLQGFYGRTALQLIKEGVVSPIIRIQSGVGERFDYYVHYRVNFTPKTYKRVGSGITLNGFKDNKGGTLYVWNDSSCEEGAGTPFADYITLNGSIVYLRDLEEVSGEKV